MKYLSLVVLAVSLASAQQIQNSLPFRSIEERKLFAGFLFCNSDYLRAAEEYAEIYSSDANDTMLFYSAVSYFRTGDFTNGNVLALRLPKGGLLLRSLEEKYRSLFSSEQFSLVTRELEKDSLFLQGTEVSRYELFYRIRHETQVAIPDTIMPWLPYAERDSILYFARLKNTSSSRSPWIAAALSALLPGAGKIYTGFISDGLTALAINGLFVYLSMTNFNAGHKTRGYIFGGAFALFYAGNVYGSAASAHIYNASVQFSINSAFDSFLSRNNYFDKGETVHPCGVK